MEYREFQFRVEPFEPFNDILVAMLSELGFESFTEEKPILKAYITEAAFNTEIENQIAAIQFPEVSITFEQQLIPKENWNKKWEESFQPIQIDDFCYIRAPFHDANPSVKFDLIIEPKMSFGTGHHATTQMMVQMMQGMALENLNVLDMGAGTGILGILALKLKASLVDAIDIEEWAFENMQENAARNQSSEVNCYLGGVEKLQALNNQYDLIIANINKNILFNQLPTYVSKLKSGGKILLSGFFYVDVEEFESWCEENQFQITKALNHENWACLMVEKRA